MEFYPWLRNLWKEWDIGVMVLVSLFIQLLLSISGNRRKYSNNLCVRFLVWSAYMFADSAATYALGILSSNLAGIFDNEPSLDANTQLFAFWTPFLLLHLGGPDTITAYAWEDNKLWTRHLFGLVGQAIMAFFVFVMAWTSSSLSVITLVMFIPGLIKYGERTWVLRSTSSYQKHTEFVVRERDFYKSVYNADDYNIKNKEGYIVGVDRMVEVQFPVDLSGCNSKPLSEEDKMLTAYGLLDIDKLLFADATLDFRDRDISKTVFRSISCGDAFEVIEIELGFIFDWLYTKIPFLYTTPWGLGLRLITFFLTCFELVLFTVLIDKDKYSKIDVCITYILLVVAVMLEIYAALVLVFSDRFVVWLSMNNKDSTIKALNTFSLPKSPRWSNKMSQYSLLRNEKEKSFFSCKFLDKIGIEIGNKSWDCEVSNHLRKIIFGYVKKKAEEATRTGQVPFTSFPVTQGGQQHGRDGIIPGTSIREELAYKIITWHIATEIWYKSLDIEHIDEEFSDYCKSINQVSRYVLSLLVEQPSILSVETSQISFEDISDQAAAESEPIDIIIPKGFSETSQTGLGDNSPEDDEDSNVDVDEDSNPEADEDPNPEADEECQSNIKIINPKGLPGTSQTGLGDTSPEDEESQSSIKIIIPEWLRESSQIGFGDTGPEAAEESQGGSRDYKSIDAAMYSGQEENNSDKSSIVLEYANKLVEKMNAEPQLVLVSTSISGEQEKKWERIGCTWLEILGYVAKKCKVNEHAEQLRRGGEFLTHVWLLLAHFGLTDNFQVVSVEEHEIARLIVK